LENTDIFYGHFEYFMDIWDILWPFGTFCFHLHSTFFPVLVSCTKKILQPCLLQFQFIYEENSTPIALKVPPKVEFHFLTQLIVIPMCIFKVRAKVFFYLANSSRAGNLEVFIIW
jgi:hypothetical protein